MAKGPAQNARRLIFHCGVQKTGSTSFHHFVRRNQARLAPHLTVLTPEKGTVTRAMGRAAMEFSLEPTEARAQDLEHAAQGVCASIKGEQTSVLISHENLLGAMLGNRGTVTLYPRLERVIEILERSFAPLQAEVALYTRDMASWKKSVFGQAVRSDAYSNTRSAFLAETADCGDWADVKRRLIAAVGDDRVRVFQLEDEADPLRPGHQLLQHAGVPADVLSGLSPLKAVRNKGLSPAALEFLRLVNGLELGRNARSKLAALVSDHPALFASEVDA